MPDQLQLRGGTTAEHSTFTGAIKEVTVDTSKKTVVVHDGTTAGGLALLRQDGSNSALALGSEGTPSLKWDANTGIFSPGDDQLAIVTGANRAITITSTQAVGVKTPNPNAALHVAGSARVGADSAADAILEIGEGATGNRNSYIDIVADTTYTDYGLRIIRNNTGANATSELKHRGTGALNFTTQEAAPIVFNTTNSPALTITSGGLVGIGTTSPSSQFSVGGASGGANPTISFDYTNDNTSKASISANHTSGEVRYSAATDYFPTFYSSGSERARIDSSGRLLVGTTSNANGGQVEAKTATVVSGNPAYDKKAFIAQIPYATSNITSSLLAGFDTNIHGVDLGYRYNGTGYDLCFATNSTITGSPTERMRIKSNGDVSISTVGAKLDLLSSGTTSAWGQGIRIGHDTTYHAAVLVNGDSNFDRMYLDFHTSSAAAATLRARLTDRFYCDVTTITSFSSERRYKQNIDVDPLIPANCWTVARDLPIHTYEYKNNPGNITYGPIVDEIESIDISLILDTGKEDEEGSVHTYDNGRLQAMYQIALQEALKRIEQLESKVAALETP